MKYLDTTIESIERIEGGRKHINAGITFMAIVSFVSLFIGTLFNSYFGIIFLSFGIFSIVVVIGLVLKREIFSMMIFLKENR